MKRLIVPAILSLSTLASLVCEAPANAAVNTNKELNELTELTTVETKTTSQLEPGQLDSDTQEVAYNDTCYIEYYTDGSYYWVCW